MVLGKKAIAVLLSLALVTGGGVAAYYGGVVRPPEVTLADEGDWGAVNEERTEIVTTLAVRNPNPVGVSIGDRVGVQYEATLNGVRLAEGEKRGVTVPSGNSTVELRTDLLNDRIAPWWVEFIRANETVELDAEARVTARAGLTASNTFTVNRTLLDDRTPVIDALSATANATRDTYTTNVTAGAELSSRFARFDRTETVTVGYEVERGWATWGPVDRNRTTVLFHFQVHNPGDVPVPAYPDGFGVSADLNDVRLVQAQGDAFSAESLDEDAVIKPGETREVVLATVIDNRRVDEWFTSHVRRDEVTDIETQLQFVVQEPTTGATFRIPDESPVTYDCRLRTAILVDNRNTSTSCGSIPSVTQPGDTREDTDSSDGRTGDPTATPTPTAVPGTSGGGTVTATPTPSPTATPTPAPPTARASADPTSGEAPLTVEFDGTESSDPDGEVVSYRWRFGDGSTPAEGPQVSHTFDRAGTYEVVLVVTDDDGNPARTTVTIEVDPRSP